MLAEAVERTATRLLAYCLLPNHWHLLVWPSKDGELSRFVGGLSLTHTQRWHAQRRSTGSGHVYQGRFQSFPVESDEHFYTVARYVERNAARAELVRRAEQWRWGSLHRSLRGSADDRALLAAWPLPRKARWVDHVNKPLSGAGGRAAVGAARQPLRRRRMEPTNQPPPGPRIDRSSARQAQEAKNGS